MPIATESARKPSRVYLRRGHPLTQGLQAAYPVFAGAGTVIRDISGWQRHGTGLGASYTTTKRGLALNFTGTDGEHATTDSFQAFNNGFTASFWYKSTANSGMMAFSKSIAGSDSMYIRFNDSGGALTSPNVVFRWGPSDNARKVEYNNSEVWDGNWHNVTTVWNGANTTKIYFDGILRDTDTDAGHNVNDADSQLYIGEWINTGFDFDGDVGGILLYDRTMPDEAIAQLYENSLAPFQTWPRQW